MKFRSRFVRSSCLLLVAGLAATGCYTDLDSFAQRRAKLECKRMDRCDKDEFWSNYYGSYGACRNDQEALIYDEFDEALCDGYDVEAGQACIDIAYEHRRNCDPWIDDKIEVACAGAFVGCLGRAPAGRPSDE